MLTPTITALAAAGSSARNYCADSPSAATGRAFAGITQPSEASNGFHRSFGFEDAGLYRRVEWKRGSWHDVAWIQLELLDGADRDAAPRPIR